MTVIMFQSMTRVVTVDSARGDTCGVDDGRKDKAEEELHDTTR